MAAQLSKFRTENPRRSSIVNGGISVRLEDGTEEGIQFTVPWSDVALACMRNSAKAIPRRKQRNSTDLVAYYIRNGYMDQWQTYVEARTKVQYDAYDY